MMKRLILLSIFGVCSLFVGKFCLKQTDSFTVMDVLSSRPYNEAWEPRSLSTDERIEVDHALTNQYRYFGRGGQSYIFFSEDGKYALKLFKQEKFSLPFWMRIFHIPYILDRYRAKKIWSREDKLFRDFTSYKIAFDELQEETGVIYVHLNKSETWKRKLTLIDRLNIEHHIEIDALDFVIQRRAELVYDRITRLMRAGLKAEAEKSVSEVIALIERRAKKGYHDRDPNVRTNCGFIGEKAIKIDVGRFVFQEKMKDPRVMKQEVIRITAPFKEWIGREYPELIPHFEKELAGL